jgi:hypothetical protein
VLITESGSRVLTSAAPKTVKDVEALMQKKGLGNTGIGTR